MTLDQPVSQFRNRARKLRNFAHATKNDAYRRALLVWAEEFDRLAVRAASRRQSKSRLRETLWMRMFR